MKFFIPNPGDTVRVRLHTGEVVDAIYKGASEYGYKTHLVKIPNEMCCRRVISIAPYSDTTCRFVAPSCDLVPS